MWAAVRGKRRPQCERREAWTGSGAEMRGDRRFPHPLWAPGLAAPEEGGAAQLHLCRAVAEAERKEKVLRRKATLSVLLTSAL